ncbi:DHA2 family efflux MFS transporter permease subunit [Apibacter adventoris]|uniref:MFS transporter n=1 Tax=Apibacter adventoris TaxID=1679466 RepID=A0A2S8AAR9_9FLAO|nr:DHA2 family efflux MFS transporter permease subunit [Apibacter adventoris]PQL91654.1 MFS transporter [Apibacter adventoris]
MQEVKISKWLPWVGAIAMFMQSLDGTILNTALPSIANKLHRSPLEMHSIIIAYTLTLALLIPLSGWLSDKFGSRNIFIMAVAIFTLGSLACALSKTLELLIITRIIQAIGGSMMVPVSRLILLYTYPKNQLLKVINFVTMPGLIGSVIGPTLGGWLVQVASWHWIFLINIPIGFMGIFLSLKVVPNYKREKGKFDFIGLFLFGLGLVLLSLSLEFGGDQTSNLWEFLITFLLGFFLLVIYVIYSKHTYSPLINLNIFKIRTLRIGIIGNLATRLGVGGVPLMLPLMLQVGYGKKPFIAGIMLIFSAITTVIAKSWVVPLVKYFGYRKLLIINTLLLGFIISLFALPNKNTPLVYFIPILILYGAINSIQMASMNSISLADLTLKNASHGNTMLSVTQQLSISFGISVSSMILRGFDASKIFKDVIFTFKATFIVLGLITILSTFIFRRLKSGDGKEMSGVNQ